MHLTEEQLKLIEERRQKAIKLRELRQKERQAPIASLNATAAVTNPWSLSIKQQSYVDQKSGPKLVKDTKTTAIRNPHQGVSNEKREVEAELVLKNKDRIELVFKFDRDVINAVKQIPTASFNSQTKNWNFDISVFRQIIQTLNSLNNNNIKINFTDIVPNNVILSLLQYRQRQMPQIDLSSKLSSKFLTSLFAFQKEGIIFGIHRNGRVLIADDMGLGKTVQALGLACWYKEDWPLLIVCPSSIRYQWKKSILYWVENVREEDIVVISNGKQDVTKSLIIIVSYDILTKMKKAIMSCKIQFVILDESHFIKNDTASRTKATIEIMKKVKRVVLLSGTPALSRPIELFTQISTIDHKTFSSKVDFGLRYCGGYMTKWGYDFRGSSNTEELKVLLESTVMIRRLKSDVLDQLPPKRRIVVMLNVGLGEESRRQMQNFSQGLTQIKQGLGSKYNPHMFKKMLFEWYNISAEVKLNAVCDYVKSLVDKEKKFICFAHHRIIIDGIAEMLENKNCSYIRIDGTTPPKTRQDCCDYFQEHDECKVAIIGIAAAGVGINLTAAQLVVFAELSWNPGLLTQAEDRAHRIGQNDSVLVEYLRASNTVDDFIWPMIKKKLQVLNDVGLSKENFKDTGITDANQKLIDDFLATINNEEVPMA
ncbi:SWI/SNF-related matrix-associated actin-dependent regulator of chromatin subfamily A-like protein 1 [Dinothrombium tinctorium]|uniref:SWI/SNF-related matrix-associated actin-dependent regulator of chromatin subfamily A-like protein 1 n=1 Tax=Dinothrombium tinctorium TaxID=1965070 RepID=A0A443QQE3_9ACAR|nr:SWI/SNF-related matrix-associated actin-dependent regulator of chromatin subfamily A-like protein 1 [Dinothrombium tinctorium]